MIDFKNKRGFASYWAKHIKRGDIIKYYNVAQGHYQTSYVVQNNHRSVWISATETIAPPHLLTVNWDIIDDVYTPEKNPEYFL